MYYIISIICILVAHLFRVYRWQLLIDTYEKSNKKNLMFSTSVGFFLNSIVPFKLGDLFRAHLGGRKMQNGRGFALATIIAERYFDVIVVGMVFWVLSLSGYGVNTALFYMFSAGTLLLLLFVSYFCRHWMKKCFKKIAGFFNAKLEFKILRFLWSLIWSFKDIFKRIDKMKLVASTTAMWILYIVSYASFARVLSQVSGTGLNWVMIFNSLFAEGNLLIGNLSTDLIRHTSVEGYICFAVYLLLPSMLLYLLSLLVKPEENETVDDAKTYLNLVPHLNPEEQLKFMELYFSDDQREYVENYLRINQDIQIIRDYSAGSNATTMLCTDGSMSFFRKYAFGLDGDKLYEQILWLQRYAGDIPITPIKEISRAENYCYYDMPCNSKMLSSYEYVHVAPVECCWNILKNVLDDLRNGLYIIYRYPAGTDKIWEYIKGKVTKNLELIQNESMVKSLEKYDTLIINGVEYPNLSFYLPLLSDGYLFDVFRNDYYSVIHGDLTIENIVIDPEHSNYYIIDPNTGNIHDSPFLDYAKLLQSLHGGYEFLMATKEISIKENQITFSDMKSWAYCDLYQRYDEYLARQFTKEELKSIYYHEIIHWLRLLPYKFRKNGQRAMLFYAELIRILKDVHGRFGE